MCLCASGPLLKLLLSMETLCYIQLLPTLQNSLQVSPPELTSGQMSQIPQESSIKVRLTLNSHGPFIRLLLSAYELLGPRNPSCPLSTPSDLDQRLVHSRVSVKVCGIKITIKQLLWLESPLVCQAPRKPFPGIISCDPSDTFRRPESLFYRC